MEADNRQDKISIRQFGAQNERYHASGIPKENCIQEFSIWKEVRYE